MEIKVSKAQGRERHLEWFMRRTGPDEAAEQSVSNDGDVRKLLKPGKV